MPKVKTHALRKQSRDELLANLKKQKEELLRLRIAKQTAGSAQKLMKIRETRKTIARINTVVTQKQRAALREHYSKKKFLPLDLRPKLTRAIRQRLTTTQLNRVSRSVMTRKLAYPKRRYLAGAECPLDILRGR